MSSLEAVIVTIIFLIPGFMVIELDNRMFSRANNNEHEIEKIINALILSMVSVIVSILILNIFKIDNIKSLKELSEKIGDFNFIFKYIAIVLVSIPITEIIYKCYRKLMLKFINFVYKLQNKNITEVDTKTAWEFIFDSANINPSDCCIEVVKNDTVITRGYLKAFSDVKSKNKELILEATNQVNEYFESEKKEPIDKKVFNEIDFEYYNLDNDVLLRFYNMSKLNTYLDETNK